MQKMLNHHCYCCGGRLVMPTTVKKGTRCTGQLCFKCNAFETCTRKKSELWREDLALKYMNSQNFTNASAALCNLYSSQATAIRQGKLTLPIIYLPPKQDCTGECSPCNIKLICQRRKAYLEGEEDVQYHTQSQHAKHFGLKVIVQ
jgi:hypothetical protein